MLADIYGDSGMAVQSGSGSISSLGSGTDFAVAKTEPDPI